MVLAGGRAVEQGDEADEARSGTRNPNARCRCVAPRARNRGHRLAAYRQCSTDPGGAAVAKGNVRAEGHAAWLPARVAACLNGAVPDERSWACVRAAARCMGGKP